MVGTLDAKEARSLSILNPRTEDVPTCRLSRLGRKLKTSLLSPEGRATYRAVVEEGKAGQGPDKRRLVTPHVGGFRAGSQGLGF